jgi:hypothetical protein
MRNVLFAVALAAAAFSGCKKSDGDKAATAEPAEDDNLPTISIDDADQALTAKQATAIDCNGDKTRKKFGIVPGAVLISDEETFPASELPPDKARKLIFYCSGPG